MDLAWQLHGRGACHCPPNHIQLALGFGKPRRFTKGATEGKTTCILRALLVDSQSCSAGLTAIERTSRTVAQSFTRDPEVCVCITRLRARCGEVKPATAGFTVAADLARSPILHGSLGEGAVQEPVPMPIPYWTKRRSSASGPSPS